MDPIRANMYGSVRFDNANAAIEILESELWIPLLEPGRVSGEADKLAPGHRRSRDALPYQRRDRAVLAGRDRDWDKTNEEGLVPLAVPVGLDGDVDLQA